MTDPRPTDQGTPRAATSELAARAKGSGLGIRRFLRERRAILANPELTVEDPDRLIGDSSLAFAIKAILIPTIFVTVLGWFLVAFAGLPAEVDEDAAAAKTLRAHRDSLSGYITALERDSARLAGDATPAIATVRTGITADLALARAARDSLTPLITQREESASSAALAPADWAMDHVLMPLLIILPAVFFRRFLAKRAAEYPRVTIADRAYVFYVAARTFIPTALIIVGDFAVGAVQRYGMVSPDGAEIGSAVVNLVGGIWQLAELARSVRPLSTALAIPRASLVAWALVKSAAVWMGIVLVILIGIEMIPA